MRFNEVAPPDHVTLAKSALQYYADMKAKHANNLGIVTSVENREGPLRSYISRGDPAAIIRFLRADDYLEGWRDEVGL